MKLCFSTIGCPGWSWEEVFATSKDLGMQGIEVRGVRDQIYAPKAEAFLPENRAATMDALNRAGMMIPCLTSGSCLSGDEQAALAEARDYIDLASAIGTKYIRVMIESTPDSKGEVDIARARELYAQILDYAAPKGVYPLIETNGVLADSSVMARFIKEVGRDDAFVLWDIHHPYRFFGEKPEYTMKNLEGLIKHVHVKDSAMEGGKVAYRMVGYGDVPIFDALRALNSSGYDGFISLEWTKRWMPTLEEPGIVFPHFFYYMQYLKNQL